MSGRKKFSRSAPFKIKTWPQSECAMRLAFRSFCLGNIQETLQHHLSGAASRDPILSASASRKKTSLHRTVHVGMDALAPVCSVNTSVITLASTDALATPRTCFGQMAESTAYTSDFCFQLLENAVHGSLHTTLLAARPAMAKNAAYTCVLAVTAQRAA